ncbi:MAG: HD domain-containing protein [Candidatus Lokiarchaeota archaeon]|nr:HD domain-containing protein [Candidatus Lokiarchaeota archaeon]MBD3337636.1 HD domain-containing protein [Candidatus Lokiarchaeota archaeon]
MIPFSNFWNAINYAFLKYKKLKRKSSNLPYVVHPIRILAILRAYEYNEFENEDLMIAALFHDIVEDTDTPLKEIRRKFGTKVANLVEELTKPEDKNKKDQWLESFKDASREAKIIKMADRIDNLLDMDGTRWNLQRKKEYAQLGLIIFNACKDANPPLANKLKMVINQILSL